MRATPARDDRPEVVALERSLAKPALQLVDAATGADEPRYTGDGESDPTGVARWDVKSRNVVGTGW